MKITGGWLTVNRACNMRCPWCYASALGYDKSVEMTPKLATSLVDLFRDLGVKSLIVLGGEPLIYSHLESVLRYVINQGMKPVIVTNGKRLANSTYVNKLKAMGLEELTISLKGVDANDYIPLSPSGDPHLFSKVCSGVKKVQDAGIGLNLSITLVQSFFNRLHELVELLIRLKPVHTTIDMGTPVVTSTCMDATGILNPQELSDAVGILQGLLRDSELDYSFYVTTPLCLLDKSIKDELIAEKRILTTCHVPKGRGLIFTPEGNIVLCNHFSSFPIGRFGVDFHDIEGLEVFWDSERVQSLRSHASMFPHADCAICADWSTCGGGCFVKWLHWDPQLYKLRRKEVE